MRKLTLPAALFILIISACTSSAAETTVPEKTSPPADEAPAPTTPPSTEDVTADEPKPFTLTSPEFVHEGIIPVKFGCDGEDISPSLEWTDPPDGTQSFVLIMDDPDVPAGTWVHWVLYNIPAESRSLPENVGAEPALADGSLHGKNSWKRTDYGGPCPPSGTHRYFFKLYALDILLEASSDIDASDLLGLMESHILAQAQLMGVYSR
jgi:Raf kinase inhibitor-like YbhB/YbcL family protein